MDFTSFFVWVDGFSLIVPKPGEESRLFAFIGPFQPAVSGFVDWRKGVRQRFLMCWFIFIISGLVMDSGDYSKRSWNDDVIYLVLLQYFSYKR
jgi:hypothetical protein